MSKQNESVKLAWNRGYRVDYEGNFISSKGNILTPIKNNRGYYCWTISNYKTDKGRNHTFNIHRLQAYQKFGDKLFEPSTQVRHINGNCLDNSWENIEIGTSSDNMMDKSVEIRRKIAKKAASKLRKFSDDEIESIRISYRSGIITLPKLAKYYNVSKSTISYIINNHTYK